MIQRELEKEIHLLRETHARTLQGTDNAEIQHMFLGKEGKDFAFSDLRSRVSFCEATAADVNDDDEGLVEIQRWIASVA